MGALAQMSMEEARSVVAWAQDVNATLTEVMDLGEGVFRADEIGVSVREGLLEPDEGRAQLAAWRAEQDTELTRLRARARDLAAGPSFVPAGKEKMVGDLTSNLFTALDSVERLLNSAQDAANRDIQGKAVNDDAVFAERYSVLQAFYFGQVSVLGATLESISDSHPERYLGYAAKANVESVILALELGRYAFGESPSEFAVEDFAAAFAANAETVRLNLARSEMRYDRMLRQIRIMPARSAEDERMRDGLLAMLETYPRSFEIERRGMALFENLIEEIEAGGTDAVFNFADRLYEFETERDAQSSERLRLAGGL